MFGVRVGFTPEGTRAVKTPPLLYGIRHSWASPAISVVATILISPIQYHCCSACRLLLYSNNKLSLLTSPSSTHASLPRSTQPRPRAFNSCPPSCPRYLAPTFCSLTALPFNSDFDGIMGLFACVPLSGDTLLHIKATHAFCTTIPTHPASHRTCAIPLHVRRGC